ncbi:substrate-binding domain-containing protein [Streptomyces sp. DH37]|uniref:substrate-binding domain-containing protein n=1 Tax=Streptomyces sp. DH37 TaxID=3040122 RepID=UPI0024435941|nr:substrate-binding domain-containing protein [Streptomyces sp. DH37]MDG9703007.1 substrate-binding domain-containing protein [Streptomyces sp. DH37]
MRRPAITPLAAAAVAAALAASCSSPGATAAAGGEEIEVALITSTSGPLASYGEQYLRGFEAGLDHVTGGTGKIDGITVKVSRYDDGGDPAKGVSLAKRSAGQGVRIIAGTAASGVATQIAPVAAQNRILYISGPAATDALTGANKYTFRSGRQTFQDVATAQRILGKQQEQQEEDGGGKGGTGRKVVVLAQDSAFGQANVAAVESVLGTDGTTVSSVLAPPSATDLTPTATKVMAAKPDMVFVAWAGDTAQSMWTTLDQQGVLDAATVVTGLDTRAGYPLFGRARGKITLFAHYVPDATDTPEAEAVEEYFGKKGWKTDLFTPDGFNAAQMVAQAVRGAGADGDTDAMVKALEGHTFSGVKGENTVRAGDHALVQPMFQARFEGDAPKVALTVDAREVAPAEKKIG